MTNAKDSLSKRLLSAEYEAWLHELAKRKGAYFEKHHEDYLFLMKKTGFDRVKAWLRRHLHDPRFDNPKAKMPSFDLSDEEINALVTYLLSG